MAQGQGNLTNGTRVQISDRYPADDTPIGDEPAYYRGRTGTVTMYDGTPYLGVRYDKPLPNGMIAGLYLPEELDRIEED